LIINKSLAASSWSHLRLLIEDAGSSEHKSLQLFNKVVMNAREFLTFLNSSAFQFFNVAGGTATHNLPGISCQVPGNGSRV
jgi:hypothetical protein